MKIEQYVMAYSVEQDRLRAILPAGFISLRPVLRVNAEIRNENLGYLEFNTAIEKEENKGWLNFGFWNEVPFERTGKTVSFKTGFLDISFTRAGITGTCPAERDNDGCYFIGDRIEIRKPEILTCNKEFCNCEFMWKFTDTAAHGVSIGKTLPAYSAEAKIVYPQKSFTVENAAEIFCEQVLGSYVVEFER